MFYIVESDDQLQRLINRCSKTGCYFNLVTSNDYFHPSLAFPVAAYFHPRSDREGYIVPLSHEDGLCRPLQDVQKILDSSPFVYVLDKKRLLYFVRLGKNCIDLNLLESMVNFQKLDIATHKIGTCNWYYNQFGGWENLNRIIPLSKLFEQEESVWDQIKEKVFVPTDYPRGFDFYNELATKLYFLVEQTGIHIDVKNFIEKFKPTNPDFSIKHERVYTSYNLYNMTSRPTNSFNAVNFLAIPHGIEYRRVFKPSPGNVFVELDWDAYHVRLVADRVGYEGLNYEESGHKQLARQYFNKQDISQDEYGKAKHANFQAIYGSVPEEFKHLEFFQKIQGYIDSLWKSYSKEKFVLNPLSLKPFFAKKLKEMRPAKLMNYMVQSLETARNVLVLKKVLKYLSGKKSKLVLITYDSFLLDYDPKESEVLEEVKKLMEEPVEPNKDVRFPVKVKEAQDLNFD